MCGAVAAVAQENIIDVLIKGLMELEYRGYDSAGQGGRCLPAAGELYVFTDAASRIEESDGVHLLHLPEHCGLLSPVLHVVPL